MPHPTKNISLEQLLGETEKKISVDALTLYYAIRTHLWVVILCICICGAAALRRYLKAPLVYIAKTTLVIDGKDMKILKEGNPAEVYTLDQLNTIIAGIRSHKFLVRVVEKLKNDPNAKLSLEKEFPNASSDTIASILEPSIHPALRDATRLIDFTIANKDEMLALQIADTLTHEFLRYQFEQRLANNTTASQFLLEESQRLRDQLQKSEEDLHQYKVENNAVSLTENQDTVIAQLKSINEKLTQVKSQRLTLESDITHAKQLANKSDQLILLPSIGSLQAITLLQTEIANKESEIAVLSQNYKPKHPKYAAAIIQLQHLKEQLNEAVLHSADNLESSYRTMLETEHQFETALKEQEQKALKLNQLSIQYNTRMREMQSNRAMFEAVLNRLKESDFLKKIDDAPFQIAEETIVTGPVRTTSLKIFPLAVFAGVVLGVGIALGLYLLNSSLKTIEEAEAFLELPVIAYIPKENGMQSEKLLNEQFWDKPTSEAFRYLYSSLSYLGHKEERRTFLFASAAPAEGKTFISYNYAVVSAQHGTATLLIDADFHRPMISKLFFNEDRKPGLSDYLKGQASFEEVVYPTNVNGLSVLTAGSHVNNSTELLFSSGFQQLIEKALQNFDRIIVDSAPIAAVSDTLFIAPYIQTICMVVRANKTPRAVIKHAIKLLSDIHCKPAGILLNCLSNLGSSAYYYYYYYSYEKNTREKKSAVA